MPSTLYVCLQDEDRIAAFALDAASGRLTPRQSLPVAGGPSVMALSPDSKVVYVGHRTAQQISSFAIDAATGALTHQATVAASNAPTFLAPDRTGRYLLVAYYQGEGAAVFPLAANGAVGAAPVDEHHTAPGAHAIATDPSNRFAFIPHIARIQDNVLEPPKNIPGPNMILQYTFDAGSGRLTANSPPRLEPDGLLGPRHYTFHPNGECVYFSNEQGSSVTLYRLDKAAGTLTAEQTISTLPAGFSARNTCSQIHLVPSGRFLYVGNRGHNSIAGFAVDGASGRLTSTGHAATEAVPSAFGLDPAGNFLFAVGTASGRLASYRINPDSGALTPLANDAVGERPAAVLAV